MSVKLSLKLKIFALSLLMSAATGRAMAAVSCDAVARASLDHTEVTSATLVASGAMTAPPGGPRDEAALFPTLPAFCRVQVTLRPAPDSEIKAEVWIPADKWNGRLEMIGNGAYSGGMMFGALARGVAKGYAVAVTDTGHSDDRRDDFYVGHPEKVTDWETRAVHETVVMAKTIIGIVAGSGPRYSYWNSCSTGGRQGWMEAEYYPTDFDGLAIGDPANPMTRLQAGSIWANLAVHKTPNSFITPQKWAMVHAAVVRECDAKDGLKDGLIENPLACHFNPKTLLCKSGDQADCLTRPQLEALEAVTNGPRNPRTGAQIYPGYPLGDPLPGSIARDQPDPASVETFRILFNDPNWDYHTFNFDTDVAQSDTLGYQKMNAVDPANLKALFARGGKILMYHGWDDPAITPLISLQLYNEAVAANGGLANTYDNIRLFMVPGKEHCSVNFDQMAVISAWVEEGKAPEMIVEPYAPPGSPRNTAPTFTRTLCPYPKVARYKGAGSTDDAANFGCVASSRRS